MDELIGYKAIRKEEELADIKREMYRLSEVGSVEERVTYARNAFTRYPNDYEIREYLAVCLYFMWQETHDTSLIGEIENLLTPVVDKCANENIRYDAINTLIWLYNRTKQTDKIMALVNRVCPEVFRVSGTIIL